jgi:epoxyqueuosine reductase
MSRQVHCAPAAAPEVTAPGMDGEALKRKIRGWAAEAGFSAAGFTGISLGDAPQRLRRVAGRRPARRDGVPAAARRTARRPSRLVPGALSVISVRMPYLPATDRMEANAAGEPAPFPGAETGEQAADPRAAASQRAAWATLADPERAYVARYALGRDYHRLVRARLESLARRIETVAAPLGRRVFCDSAPLMEVELASRAGIGWRGKHTLLLSRDEGSWFFLGEIVDHPRPAP